MQTPPPLSRPDRDQILERYLSRKQNKRQKSYNLYHNSYLTKKILITVASIFVGLLIIFILGKFVGSISIFRPDVVGTYINKDNPNILLEIEQDGRYCVSGASLPDMQGEWRLKGNKLIASPDMGSPSVSKVRGNKIIDDDGMVWIKLKERKISAADIAGRYVKRASLSNDKDTLDIFRNGGFIYRSKMPGVSIGASEDFIIRGDWEIAGDKLKLFATSMSSGDYSSSSSRELWTEGEVKGNIIRTNVGWFVKQN